MNIKDNKRKKDSNERIQKAFIELIQTKEINEITVSNICKLANLNRSTFYSNYLDIYDLANKIKTTLFQNVLDLYKKETQEKTHSYDFLKLLKHIKENQLFYKTYFKLDFDSFDPLLEQMIDYNEFKKYYGNTKHINYHVTFFKYGFNAVIKKWLHYGCVESPEEIRDIIISEYTRKL